MDGALLIPPICGDTAARRAPGGSVLQSRGWLGTVAILFALAGTRVRSEPLAPSYFEKTVRPLLAEYCLNCHSTEKHKGDLDLERLNPLSEAIRQPKIWQQVAEQLALGEMPPKDKPQPTLAERTLLSDWIGAVLEAEATRQAGDPGQVVLRRLNNAEYTYTVQDLTGVALNPTREFPADSAAGEGFMNTGSSLVMSPALFGKYLDAAKDVCSHAVFLPDGLRFSPGTTSRDWTDECLAKLRSFYREFAQPDGKIPLERYLAATLAIRAAAPTDPAALLASTARSEKLNPLYLTRVWQLLDSPEPSIVLSPLRDLWAKSKPQDAPQLAASWAAWQKALWEFKNVGWMKRWMEPVDPVVTRQEFRLKIPETTNGQEITVYLLTTDAGDGNAQDFAIWDQPRLVAPGRPEVRLRDVRELGRVMTTRRDIIFTNAAVCLTAASEAGSHRDKQDWNALAARHGVDLGSLLSWLDYLGLRSSKTIQIPSYLTLPMASVSGYSFVKGWGSTNAPYVIANSSDETVRVPGTVKARGVTLYPSSKLQCAVGWASPVSGSLRVEGSVTPANPECGNGVTWTLELRRGATRQRLAEGIATGRASMPIGPFENLAVERGDLLSLWVGPRDGDNGCDYTSVELAFRTPADGREWNLGRDISGDILAANPHADSFGNPGAWHFYTEPASGRSGDGSILPTGSLLAKWQTTEPSPAKQHLAHQIQQLLLSPPPAAKDHPDAQLRRELTSLGGPVFMGVLEGLDRGSDAGASDAPSSARPSTQPVWGLDPSMFGRHPNGRSIEASSLCLQAPTLLEVRLPAELVAGCDLIATGVLDRETSAGGSVQMQMLAQRPLLDSAGRPVRLDKLEKPTNEWIALKPGSALSPALPILVEGNGSRKAQVQAAMDEFRSAFPPAVCYSQIVPVDEAVTLTLFHREDDHLTRLMLTSEQKTTLDRLWEELYFVSQAPLKQVDAYEQIMEFTTQDRPDLTVAFKPLRQPILERAADFRKRLTDKEPRHLEAVVEFADQAYRRPLTSEERAELRNLYHNLRSQEIPHSEAIRLTLAKVFVAPAFLYRLENSPSGVKSGPVSDWELASRLSYFLWSSQPDAELRRVASSGRLSDPDVLAVQARRMLKDPRVRRMAIQFASQWLHIHDFDQLDEKSEKHFPSFGKLREPMYEEVIRFFTDLFQNEGSVLSTLDADHTFLNEKLAKHYGIPGVNGDQWRRVDGIRKYSRGGILGFGAVLAKQSGASRTSPILRGNWVAETLLGEKLPRPPKDVPVLPDDEAVEILTVRQLVERHTSDPKCSGCHLRIDGYGFALEGFDAIGRARDKDLADRLVNTQAKLLDGTEVSGMSELRDYIQGKRQQNYIKQFGKKLLGYALGRSVQLSDTPMINEMATRLRDNEFRFSIAIDSVVRSRQFREIRGREHEDQAHR